MKKIILSCAAALLAIGSACATPKFLSLNNKHGKTTIKIEIPASDRDETNGLSIEDVVLYNDGKTFQAKKVDAIWGDNSIVILQFEKLTAFEDCTLFFCQWETGQSGYSELPGRLQIRFASHGRGWWQACLYSGNAEFILGIHIFPYIVIPCSQYRIRGGLSAGCGRVCNADKGLCRAQSLRGVRMDAVRGIEGKGNRNLLS